VIRIDVRTNARQIASQVRLDATEMRTATMRALNRAADGTRVDAGRKIRETYNVTNKVLQPAFYVRKATRDFLTAVVGASGRPMRLIGFGARQVAAGVSVAIKRGSRKVLRGAFIARMKSGHTGVFMRRGAKRLPVDEKYTVSVPGMLGARQIEGAIRAAALARFDKAMDQNVRFLVGRRRG
jgi:hypothetical protein